MSIFGLHSPETAPEQSRDVMASVASKFGFIPNIYGVLAESPAVIKAYTSMTALLGSTSFSPAEQQLMLLTISASNKCEYCVAAHTLVGKRFSLDEDAIDAVRAGRAIADPRLNALHGFTKSVVESRGNVTATEVDDFIAAGFSKAQTLEVVLATALKTMSNYINHFADTPLDEAFRPEAWNAPVANVA